MSTQQSADNTQKDGYRAPSLSILVSCVLCAVCCVLTMGCIHRSLTIRSEPPGAEVLVNDKVLGTTPHTYDFQWYGWYRITLTKAGYERLDDRTLIEAPAHLWIPFDLIMELLPLHIRDDKLRSYTLRPKQPLPEPTPPVLETPPDRSEASQFQEPPDGQAR